MVVYRICKTIHSNDLSGYGASLSTNRWNSKGIFMLYTAESRSLAMAKVLIHNIKARILPPFSLISIQIPDDIPYRQVPVFDFSDINTSRKIGDDFIREGEFMYMKVPSIVVSGDFNFILNPKHPDFKKVQIEQIVPFKFDERFF